ncbi:MAG: class I SAM-dependent methyltransferase, partial [Candidatus Aenigmatarchaeota archaeon]
SIVRSCFDDNLDKAKIIQRCIQLGRRDLANQLLQQIKNLDLKDMETLVSLYQNEAQNQEEDVKIEYIDVLREPSTARIYTESTETEIGDILPKKHFKGRRVIVKGLKQAEMPKEIPILLRLERAKNTIDSYFIHKKELEGKEEYLREGYKITRAYQSSYRLLQNLLNLEELEGKTVLDLGCGSNSPLMQVLKDKKINANVVGLDSHKKSLQICKEKFSENEFIQALYPYTLFSFRSSSFDWIFAINCLHYTNEKSEICATLIGLDQLLKKGGRIVIIEPRSQSKMKFNAELKKNLSEMGYNVEEYNKYIKWPGPQYSHHLILVGEKINEVDRSQEYKKAIAASLIKTNRFEEAKKIVEDLGLTLSDIIKEKEKEMVCIRKPKIRKVYKEPKRVFSFEENLKLYSLIRMVKTTKIYSRDLAEKMFDKIFNYYFQKTEKLKKFRPYVASR